MKEQPRNNTIINNIIVVTAGLSFVYHAQEAQHLASNRIAGNVFWNSRARPDETGVPAATPPNIIADPKLRAEKDVLRIGTASPAAGRGVPDVAALDYFGEKRTRADAGAAVARD